MTTMIATDLDRTLVFSPRAIAELGGALPAQVVETLDGRPVSELADEVAEGLASPRAEIVPVTTRTPEQLARLQLPLHPAFVIAACGAVILADGMPDAGWAAVIGQRVAAAAPLERATDLLRGHPGVLRAYRSDAFAYAVVAADFDGRALAVEAGQAGYVLTRSGRKAYLLPNGLDKAAAVSHVAARIGADRVLAAGDSLLDRSMLELADRAWVPRGSELAADPPPRACITQGTGHAAAVEIVTGWRSATSATAACAS